MAPNNANKVSFLSSFHFKRFHKSREDFYDTTKKALNNFYFKLLLRKATSRKNMFKVNNSDTNSLSRAYVQRYVLVPLLQTHSVYYSSLPIVNFERAVTYTLSFILL